LARGRELHLDTEDALSPKQLAAHAKEALGGDAEAAYALSRHYAFFENDVVESNFWLQLSAELGYCPAVDEYVARIRKLESLRSEKRLKRWEERYRESCGKRKAPDH
jgi:hypothetical protein